MYTRLSRHISLFLLLIAAVSGATAQTIRVSNGISSDGRRCYREVFEYDYVTDKPSFPGGDGELVTFINTHRTYPGEAYRRGVEGRVTCSFVVNADGSVSHIKVIKGVETTLNNEAMRVLALMPSWVPGRLGGQPVPVRVIWSVPFRK
ncbi:MAG: energy transducer TonB [Muribaculaceae bacterium]|nr:energy transducer TonB [Muribaculaceae bacterium]